MRIEDSYAHMSPDMISARALAPMIKLLGYGAPWLAHKPQLEFLLMKGAQAEQEIAEAQNVYDFNYTLYPSETDPASSIVHIANLCIK